MNIVITKKFAMDVDEGLTFDQKQELALILISITECKSLSEIRNCKKLKGFTNAYRIRFGDFRIDFLWKEQTIFLSRVLNRKTMYKYFP